MKKLIFALIIISTFITICEIYAAVPGEVTDLDCTSGHDQVAITEDEIRMEWDYPDGYDSNSIDGFYVLFNQQESYTFTVLNTAGMTLRTNLFTVSTDDYSNSDNVAYYFHIAAQDKAFPVANIGTTSSYGPMRIDNVSPVGSIAGPLTTTSNIGVPITVTVSGAAQMCLRNDENWGNCGWEGISTLKTINLTSGEGTKTVYAKFKDSTGNESSSSTTITYDELPTGSISSITTTTTTDISLTITSSAATLMCIRNDTNWDNCNWEAVTTSKSWTLTSGSGEKIVYAKFKDDQNNTVTDSITITYTEPPQLTKKIPTLNEWGIIIFIALLLLSAMNAMRSTRI